MFKKILAVVTAVVLGFVLAGCSSSSTSASSKTFVNDSQQGVTMELTYYYEGDKVTRQTVKNTLVFADLGQTREVLEPQIRELAKSYEGVKGIKYDLKVTDTEVVEVADVDYTNLDFEKAKSLPGITIQGDAKNGVSMKASEKLLLEQGFKVKE